ncbi:TIGR01244 family sulfur transferase [Halodurantibacterium flavum]|uniref:TIGR01244 family sulfur transferase n=1 Tax=Halodurantibacterium flavum TaxID=1382802 RepID=A0ABW4S9T9_9RHOB
MQIRPLTPGYAVSPQIAAEDVAAIRDAGYTTIISNRPDAEVAPDHHASEIRAAAEAAGLKFVENPVISGALTMENVIAQGEAIAAADGPILAYCASGNRSSTVWALSQAGDQPTDDLIGLPARHGYQLEHLRPQIEALAAQKKNGQSRD